MAEDERVSITIGDDIRQRIDTLATQSNLSEAEILQHIFEAAANLLDHHDLPLPAGVLPDQAESILSALDAIAYMAAQQSVNAQRVIAYRAQMAELEDRVDPISREAMLVQRALTRCREDWEEELHARD